MFCVDEMTAIQALDRLDPVLPLSPDRAERHGLDYYRHGTLSLYAALDTQSGKVLGKTAARHTSRSLWSSSQGWSNERRRGRSTSFRTICRRTRVRWFALFSPTHLNVHFHFTPTICRG